MRANLKRHIPVYILSSEHSYRTNESARNSSALASLQNLRSILLYLRGSSFFDMLGIVVVVLRTDQSFSCDKPLVERPRCTWEVMGSNPTGDLNLKHLSYLS